MKIDRDTICCISIAERPGNFGATVLNATFQALNLNYIYKPFRVMASDLEDSIKGIRAFGIRGCGVSMPHKIKVMQCLDQIDDAAKRIGAVNTIINNNGVLTGYNTDYEGAKRALKETYDIRNKKALIIGAGGAARAIIVALKDSGAGEIWLTNRDEARGQELAKEFSLNYHPFATRAEFRGQLLVNATPVGMPPNGGEMIIDKLALIHYDCSMDVVVSPQETGLIQTTKELGKAVIPGFKMALYQGVAQYELYTEQEAPFDLMSENIQKYFKA